MKITLSVIKADVGSIGGHTMPSERMVDAVRQKVSSEVSSGSVSYTHLTLPTNREV